MKQGWEYKVFEDCIEKIKYTIKVQRKDFLEYGKYPIISQEKASINGYWNNIDDLYVIKKPVIIFGDHTQVIKYIDFDFVLGADGVKIIKPKSYLDSLYFYYYLINLDIRKLGYARHYKLLNGNKIPIPPLTEQQQIVKILDKAFKGINQAKENAERSLINARELFESYLQSIFANPNKDWEIKKLGEVCEKITRGQSPKYLEFNGLCVLNQKCIRDHKINYNYSRFHDDNIKPIGSDKLIQLGDVLVNSTGTGTLGRVAQVLETPCKAFVDSHITIVRPIKNVLFYPFFGYVMIYIEDNIAEIGEGCGGQTELSRSRLKNEFKISYPKSLTEQQEIVEKLDALSEQTKKLEKIYEQKLLDLEELNKSLLNKAFNGELTRN